MWRLGNGGSPSVRIIFAFIDLASCQDATSDPARGRRSHNTREANGLGRCPRARNRPAGDFSNRRAIGWSRRRAPGLSRARAAATAAAPQKGEAVAACQVAGDVADLGGGEGRLPPKTPHLRGVCVRFLRRRNTQSVRGNRGDSLEHFGGSATRTGGLRSPSPPFAIETLALGLKPGSHWASILRKLTTA